MGSSTQIQKGSDEPCSRSFHRNLGSMVNLKKKKIVKTICQKIVKKNPEKNLKETKRNNKKQSNDKFTKENGHATNLGS